jgi:hypothetical protein
LELIMGARRITFRVQPPVPFGDVTLVPAALTGRSEVDMGRAMAAALADVEVSTAADALKQLRQAFPMAPLNTRLAALGEIMERVRRSF